MISSFFMEGEQSSPNFQFPPGFRFHPSDEELIVYYLRNKATSRPLPASVIAEVDLYKYNPWELPMKALFGEDEWYFFSPRDRKYPNGERPNRAAGSGYWKATGTDKPIFSCYGSKKLGVKKALVFYTGRPPKGVKTDWMMNEYRLLDTTIKPSRLEGSMRLDDWVLCRVRLKSSIHTNASDIRDNHKAAAEETARYSHKIEEARFAYTNQNTDMITDCLYKDCRLLALMLANEALPPIETISSVSCQGSNNGNTFTSTYGDLSDKVNAPLTVSPLDAYFNPLKRKPSEENRSYENLLPTNPKPHGDNKLTFPNNDLNYSSQNQESIYPNMSDLIIDFQGLNELAFTSKYSDY